MIGFLCLMAIVALYMAFKTPTLDSDNEAYWIRRAMREEQYQKLRDPQLEYDSVRGIRQ